MVIQGVNYPSDFEAKKAIIAVAAKLEAKGFQVAGDGSLSVRVGPNAIWITVEGADKAALQQDQLVRIDLSGKQMATNKPKPLCPSTFASTGRTKPCRESSMPTPYALPCWAFREPEWKRPLSVPPSAGWAESNCCLRRTPRPRRKPWVCCAARIGVFFCKTTAV